MWSQVAEVDTHLTLNPRLSRCGLISFGTFLVGFVRREGLFEGAYKSYLKRVPYKSYLKRVPYKSSLSSLLIYIILISFSLSRFSSAYWEKA